MASAHPSPDGGFRAQVAAGDLRGAAEWLVRAHARDVMSLCVAMVRDRAVAEDLAQDAFSRAFAHLADFRHEASAATWLLSIARNRCLDHLRAIRRDPWAGAPPGDDEAGAVADDVPLAPDQMLQRADVERALASLSENERALVVLRFESGLEYDELAAAFGLRQGTVRMRISRALARMRQALDERALEGSGAPGLAAPAAAPRAPAAAPAQRMRSAPGAAPLWRGFGGAPEGVAPPGGAGPPPPRRLGASMAALREEAPRSLYTRLAALAERLATG